jgi:hydroxyacylglutathione hydrolase
VFVEHPEAVERSSRLTVDDLMERQRSAELQIVDVRNRGELEAGTIPGARTLALPELVGRLDELDRDTPTVVYCAGGYRSSIAASLMRANGFADVSDLLGGYGAWVTAASPGSAPDDVAG